MNRIEELEKIIKKAEKEIEEIKSSERFKPELNEKYWYISKGSYVNTSNWCNNDIDNIYYNIYNCFRTKEEAKNAYKRIFHRLLF